MGRLAVMRNVGLWLLCLLVAVIFVVGAYIVLFTPAVYGPMGTKQIPPWFSNLQVRADIYQKVVTPTALVLGAIFAYYRLRRERTHVARFDSSVECEATNQDGRTLLKGSVTCTNVGNSDIKLDGLYCDVTVYSRRHGEEARWREDYRSLFEHDPVVEPGETAEDSIWFETDSANRVAIEVEARIARNINGGQIRKEIVILKTSNDNDVSITVRAESAQRVDSVLTKLREVLGW